MGTILRSIASVALVVSSMPVAAAELWQGAQSGWNATSVQKAFPNARPPSTKSVLGNGATCELQIIRYVVADKPFDVCFYFRAGKLEQVTLSYADSSDQSGSVAYETIVSLLRAKYGPESDKDSSNSSLMLMRQHNWYRGEVNISTILLNVGRSKPTLNVNYQTRASKEAAKL